MGENVAETVGATSSEGYLASSVCCSTGLQSFSHVGRLRRRCRRGSARRTRRVVRRDVGRAALGGRTVRTSVSTDGTGTDAVRCACGSGASTRPTERTSTHSPSTGTRTASHLHMHTPRATTAALHRSRTLRNST